MEIEGVGAKKATDIFAGNHTSFYVNEKGQLYAFGLNNHGQLGIGNQYNTIRPTLVKELKGVFVKHVAGGEHHTIAVSNDN